MQPTSTVTLPVTRSTFIAGSVALIIVVALLSAFLSATITVRTIPKPPAVNLTPLREQQAYGRVIAIDYPLDVLNYNLSADNCSYSSSTAECEVDLANLARDDGKFSTDLKALKVPACLASANALFLQALPQEQSGATALEQAVKNNDAGAASTAQTQLSAGFNGIDRAMTAYKAAIC